MTITIEKPETEKRLLALAASRGISPTEALELALDALASLIEEPEADRPLTPTELRALGRSLADADAGRVISGDRFFAELRADLPDR